MRLVLLRKEGRPATSPSAYRPLCLLDEIGKLLERVVAARLRRHMSGRVPDWHDRQCSFRKGCSTIDAIRRVQVLTEEMVSQDGVAFAVSLDIVNAFDTMP